MAADLDDHDDLAVVEGGQWFVVVRIKLENV